MTPFHALAAVGCLAITITSAAAQSTPPARACWLNYASCAGASYGDVSWRSICYADFAGCLATAPVPACTADAAAACQAYQDECAGIAAGDPTLVAQCSEDLDACNYAMGC